MILSRFWFTTVATLALIFLTFLPSYSAQQGSPASVDDDVRIETRGSRALRDSLIALEVRLKCTINYEDPLYARSSMKEIYRGGPIVPISHFVSFSFNPQNSQSSFSIIKNLVADYNQHDATAQFTVVQSLAGDDIFDVFPVKSENDEGILVQQDSLLSNTISLSRTDTYANLLQQICNQVNPRLQRKQLVEGDTVSETFQTQELTLDVSQQSARYALDQLIASYRKNGLGSLSWVIDNDLDQDSPVLFNHVVMTPEPPNPVLVNVESDRPLVTAIQIIADNTHAPYMYEDPPWECQCEVIRNRKGVPQSPRGGVVSFNFSASSSPQDAIVRCISAYHAQDYPGVFSVRQIGKISYIFPTQSMTLQGKPRIITLPLLQTRIDCAGHDVTVASLARTICRSIAKIRMYKVQLGVIPNSVAQAKLTLNKNQTPASECLAAISNQLGRSVSWFLLYDPKLKLYKLNSSTP